MRGHEIDADLLARKATLHACGGKTNTLSAALAKAHRLSGEGGEAFASAIAEAKAILADIGECVALVLPAAE